EERADRSQRLTPFGEIKPGAKFTRTKKKNYALQVGDSVAIKVLITTLAERDIKRIHVLHDEVWNLQTKEMNLDIFIKQVEVAIKEKIKKKFQELPKNGILTKEK